MQPRPNNKMEPGEKRDKAEKPAEAKELPRYEQYGGLKTIEPEVQHERPEA
jgi:hypothetical protein